MIENNHRLSLEESSLELEIVNFRIQLFIIMIQTLQMQPQLLLQKTMVQIGSPLKEIMHILTIPLEERVKIDQEVEIYKMHKLNIFKANLPLSYKNQD